MNRTPSSRQPRFKSKTGLLPLKWEITLVLIVKVVLLYAIWSLWFDRPVPREHRAEHVSRIILNK